MHAYDDRDFSKGEAMNAVWVVDDDRSIRWVLEKALARDLELLVDVTKFKEQRRTGGIDH